MILINRYNTAILQLYLCSYIIFACITYVHVHVSTYVYIPISICHPHVHIVHAQYVCQGITSLYYTNDSMHIYSNTSCYNVNGKDCHHHSLTMVSWLHAYALVTRVQLKDSKMSVLSLLGTQIIIISSWNHGAYYRLCQIIGT